MRVYPDLAVLLNMVVDGLLLLAANRLTGQPPGWRRCGAATALGGIYGWLCMWKNLRFLENSFWRLLCLGLMGLIAFGTDKDGRKQCGLFVLMNMALGGIVTGVGNGGFPLFLLSAAGLWLLCRSGFDGDGGGKEYVPLELRYGDRVVHLTALRDTGNTLRDPITGEPVLVIGADAARKLTGLTAAQLRSPLETLGQRILPGLRLIPYRTVGQCGGMLLALRLGDVRIGKRQGQAVVAFAPERIGGKDGYQALTGGGL